MMQLKEHKKRRLSEDVSLFNLLCIVRFEINL